MRVANTEQNLLEQIKTNKSIIFQQEFINVFCSWICIIVVVMSNYN